MSDREKTRVLFVCVHNSARSQMAEALLKELGGEEYHVESAGFEPSSVNPLAVETMRQIGIDISRNETHSVFDFFKEGRLYEYVITVCDDTDESRCPIFPGITERLHWPFPDLAALSGSQEEKLTQAAEIRDEIKERISQWVEEKSLT